jgi:hypothetical protein
MYIIHEVSNRLVLAVEFFLYECNLYMLSAFSKKKKKKKKK